MKNITKAVLSTVVISLLVLLILPQVSIAQTQITITKQTNPANNGQQFAFSSNIPGNANFNVVSGGGRIINGAPADTYTITEAVTVDYTLSDIDCNALDFTVNLANRSVTIVLGVDEEVSCTFTNLQHGSITISKNTVPAGGLNFNFDENISAPDGTFMLDDGESLLFNSVSPGTYTVSEDDPTVSPGGFVLSDIVCDDMGSSTNVQTRTATIDLDPNEDITCTFTNTSQLEGLTITKNDVPDPVSAGDELAYIIDIQNGSDFTATNAMVVDSLPAGLIGVSAESNLGGVSCQFDNISNPQTVTCTLPNLPPQQILTITIRVIPDPDFYDENPTIIQNTATLTADPGNEVRVAMTETLVIPLVDITIERGNEIKRVERGRKFTVDYDITVDADNQQALADLNSEDIQIRTDALDVMLEVDFPGEFEVDSVETSQGSCVIGSVLCDLGDIQEGQTVRVSIVFIAPDVRGDFTIGAFVTVLGGQSFSDFIFVSVRNDNSDCSLAAAGSTGTSNLLYLLIPLFIFTRRYWKTLLKQN